MFVVAALFAKVVSVERIGFAQRSVLIRLPRVGREHGVILLIPVVDHLFGLFWLVRLLIVGNSLENQVGIVVAFQIHYREGALVGLHVVVGEHLGSASLTGFGLACRIGDRFARLRCGFRRSDLAGGGNRKQSNKGK